ncbi:transmembrane protein 217-like [Rhineura floridana]|uniref:transmembrane protein 217-like n=1 Tax=Rhineura floridana TaxID=261503 RepID=UPI002AC7FA8D|nr:transmembrane protein 217-like [Rhineura floridana]
MDSISSRNQGFWGGRKMIILFAGGFCGIAPKTGSLLAGVYMILMTNMYLIFEAGHLNRSLVQLQVYQAEHYSGGLMWVIPYCYYLAIALALVTYPVCIYFFYSIHKRHTVGMFVYIAWIIFYDLANVVLLILTSNAAKTAMFSLSVLEWFGLATRIPTDCFWLCFIITYVLMIFEGRSTGRMSLKSRRISRHVAEPPRFRLGINTRRVQ